MRLKFIRITLFAVALCLISPLYFEAQTKKKESAVNRDYPATFTISKTEFDRLFSLKPEELVASDNAYIKGSQVMMNTLNGDMKFLKLKLSHFKNAFLMVQVNGIYSTQIFILSQDKSVFYKGKIDKEMVIMTKCNEDDIVSE